MSARPSPGTSGQAASKSATGSYTQTKRQRRLNTQRSDSAVNGRSRSSVTADRQVELTAAVSDVLPFPDRCPQQLGVCAGHDAGLDIIAESEDRDGGPANGEARRGNNGWDQTLEPLPALRKLAIAVPSAVRNMRAPRAKASDQNAVAITSNPVKAPRRGELISGVD